MLNKMDNAAHHTTLTLFASKTQPTPLPKKTQKKRVCRHHVTLQSDRNAKTQHSQIIGGARSAQQSVGPAQSDQQNIENTLYHGEI